MATTRERMVISTALLVRERGARATSIDDVLAHSGAPRGSVYHHFPGGRQQLLSEAVDYAGEFIAKRIERADDPLEVLDLLLDDYREQLVDSGFRAGCPVVAVAVEAGEPDSNLHEHAGAAFGRWQELLEQRLAARGVKAPRAAELAALVIASIEGAIVMARARRDIEPIDNVHSQLRSLLRAEISEGSSE
jgi:AcrR family transcriptional regulator